MRQKKICWACGKSDLKPYKSGIDPMSLTSSDFSITDKRYGKTLQLERCNFCGFLQASIETDRLLKFYRHLEDSAYVATESPRAEQQREFLKSLKPFLNGQTLLDVGAGSGVLVGEARKLMFSAEGVEPSLWLVAQAKKNNVELILGTLSDVVKKPIYDVITFVDVLEHIVNPKLILEDAYERLKPDGHLALVIPDSDSIAARMLGTKWWHFRIAHIGYFHKKNISILLERSGFKVISFSRPSWYFPLNYLVERVLSYVPFGGYVCVPKFLERFVIRLNLFDSWVVVCKKV